MSEPLAVALPAESPPGPRVCPACLDPFWHPGGAPACADCGAETLPREWDAYYDGRAGRRAPEKGASPAEIASHAAGAKAGRLYRRA